uniref:Uncharacterized protein n=2 Tax=Pseudocrenilabrinae TaxID=318546 RepID=A0A3B4F4Z4_9CICH
MALEEQCSAPPRWRSISLTHVEFPEDDLTGHLLAYISLIPIAILVGFVTLIVFKRELHTVSPAHVLDKVELDQHCQTGQKYANTH